MPSQWKYECVTMKVYGWLEVVEIVGVRDAVDGLSFAKATIVTAKAHSHFHT